MSDLTYLSYTFAYVSSQTFIHIICIQYPTWHLVHAPLSTSGRGNIHLGTTYYNRISIPFVVTIGVVHHRFLKFNLINSEASSVPSIRSYCALNVVISVCHISLIDSTEGRLFAENTLVHIVVHMHHMVMGASNIHKSPNFCFCTITTSTLLLVIIEQFHSPLYNCFACTHISQHHPQDSSSKHVYNWGWTT